MRTLAIDCSTEACSIALFEDDALVANDHRVLGRGHAEHLVPMIAQLPDKGCADRILVARGPGSFTGVRIGIATARALGLAWKADIAGYPTLGLVAAMAHAQHPGESLDVAMTGGHGDWFVQSFDPFGAPASPNRSMAPDAAIAAYRAEIVAGTEAEALVSRRGYGTALSLHPDASFALSILPDLLGTDVSPIYGRAPDAKPARPRPKP
ncbi:tRNA (adenosine(37)-N6)-threonylcarbamoyltransferase complex dimerization subunit type 1 TsaB [Parerythrobacter jejuensis]|uniref:tRNA (Adenosine(37)-N6)-threonylcarbamoyltransferase complex dimerization subunit type 1 TsaB n=1 Tax=Parerythrobacter jejuensis TaxID=795812 RepID=A0A845AT77_9SPHN|nr:tRNA (adenosine(37)-N6)-threonylcarbamoyltransferase complex dimerization subunit type 1 TsaB [Parerythrobacter jejuensis]MXP32804.1 tRNA (adenosine(37)-N6)-threonylcarbamoyltransferase complex dimerization subunit type 1 TsaB [Parerythrobacter jejuensis]